jgi:hypothetical protein
LSDSVAVTVTSIIAVAAIEKLAEYLEETDLHAVFPKLMSEQEEANMKHQ